MSAPFLPITSPAAAVASVAAALRPAPVERIPLASALGRVLAEPLVADRPSPPCDVSSMDGYAVRLTSITPGLNPIRAESIIGRAPPAMPDSGVVRIVTGAPIPTGADAVIKREDTTERPDEIEIAPAALAAIRPGDNIRRRGENLPARGEAVSAGRVITPAMIGALAAFGCATVSVRRRVRVAVLSTGDELLPVDAAAPPTDWQIRDSNGPALAALLSARPFLEVVAIRREPDEPGRLEAALRSMLAQTDALLTVGGVSAGHRDFIPSLIRDLGGRVLFHKLPQRPGRPMLAAATAEGKIILGLPGNPVSALVTARRIAIPSFEHAAGIAEPGRPTARLRATGGSDKRLDLWWHRPVRLSPTADAAEIVANLGSGDVVSAARSDGFIEVHPGEGGEGPWPFWAWT